MKTKINKILAFCIVLFCIGSCSSQSKKQQQYSDERDKAFMIYLESHKIPVKKLTDSVFNAHYGNFLKFEKRIKLEANPYLKINKVYVYNITPNSVEFKIYSDDENFYLSTFDLDIDGEILSFPENGVVKVLEPIKVEYFGDFEILGNIIKTRKRRASPFKETYYYVNGTIQNDRIHYTERYIGKEEKFEKKLLAKTYKDDFIEVYQPNLKARKYINGAGLISYEVTGEFNVEK